MCPFLPIIPFSQAVKLTYSLLILSAKPSHRQRLQASVTEASLIPLNSTEGAGVTSEAVIVPASSAPPAARPAPLPRPPPLLHLLSLTSFAPTALLHFFSPHLFFSAPLHHLFSPVSSCPPPFRHLLFLTSILHPLLLQVPSST